MSSPLIALGFILLCACTGFAALFLKSFYQKKFINALIFKGVASLCFIIFGAFNCFTGELSHTKILVFIGLCLGIIGDEIIALCQVLPKYDMQAFIGGGAFFLIGHIIYALALLLIGEMSWILMIVAFLVAAALSIAYEKRKRFLSHDMKKPLVMYLGIVIFMASVAIGLFVKRLTLGAGLFALGGVLFSVSDNILFAYKLGEKPKFSQNIILHVTYYLAQFAIAWSISLI